MANNNSSAGYSLFFVVGIVFVTLKLTGVIDWSWVWVLCPFWGPLALFCAVLLVCFAGFLIISVVLSFLVGLKSIIDWNERRNRVRT